MKSIVRELPCTPVINGAPTMHQFTGVDVGPMFVHQCYPDGQNFSPRGNWTITHIATGYSVHKHISTKARALNAARQLAALGCWDFSDVKQAKAIPAGDLFKIKQISEAA